MQTLIFNMSELGEHTKSLTKRKDAVVEAVRRREFFTFFDRTTKKPNGEFIQTARFEENGVLEGSAKLIEGSENLFRISFEIVFLPNTGYSVPLQGEHGENLVLMAQDTKGELFGSLGKLESQEGARQITFNAWTRLNSEILEKAVNRKGDVLSAVKKGRPEPLPSVPRNNLDQINFVFA